MAETVETKQNECADGWSYSRHVREFTEDLPELKFTEEELALFDRVAKARHRALDLEMKRELQDMMKERAAKIYGE